MNQTRMVQDVSVRHKPIARSPYRRGTTPPSRNRDLVGLRQLPGHFALLPARVRATALLSESLASLGRLMTKGGRA